jgi:hypothetical protein
MPHDAFVWVPAALYFIGGVAYLAAAVYMFRLTRLQRDMLQRFGTHGMEPSHAR